MRRYARPRESGRAERCEGLFVFNLELSVFQKVVRADVFGEGPQFFASSIWSRDFLRLQGAMYKFCHGFEKVRTPALGFSYLVFQTLFFGEEFVFLLLVGLRVDCAVKIAI